LCFQKKLLNITSHTETYTDSDFEKGTVLLFDKEYRWTSFDLVHKVRNLLTHKLKIKKLKVGHAGTLDPLATGLLVICTGKMTKKIEELQNTKKEYIATFEFGKTTPCFDLEKPYDKDYPFEHITLDLIKANLPLFQGEIEQIPPLFSAKMVDGQRAYELARKGSDLELKPNLITIDEIEILDFKLPILTLRILCSKGTYIRSLARDLGIALQSGAHLTALRRTKSGSFDVAEAIKIGIFEKILLYLQP
jgi:tRNA pseudouridine55 synthase